MTSNDVSPEEDIDADDILRRSMALSDRRLYLCASTPPCISCGEYQQIQLVSYDEVPAEWKCRTCKHKFTFEPLGTPYVKF